MEVMIQASDDISRSTKYIDALNGKTNEVGTREDLVAALRNMTVKANNVAFA